MQSSKYSTLGRVEQPQVSGPYGSTHVAVNRTGNDCCLDSWATSHGVGGVSIGPWNLGAALYHGEPTRDFAPAPSEGLRRNAAAIFDISNQLAEVQRQIRMWLRVWNALPPGGLKDLIFAFITKLAHDSAELQDQLGELGK